MDYKDQLNIIKGTDAGKRALGRISMGELGWQAAGAGAGGLAGWLLAKILHKKPSVRTKLLYSLFGAGIGAGGTELALKHMPGTAGFEGSKADEMRLHGLTIDVPAITSDHKEHPLVTAMSGGKYYGGAGTAGALYGAYKGMQNPNSLKHEIGDFANPYDWLNRHGERARHKLMDSLNNDIIISHRNIDITDAAGNVIGTRKMPFGGGEAANVAKTLGWDPALTENGITLKRRTGDSIIRGAAGAAGNAALFLGVALLARMGAKAAFGAEPNVGNVTVTKDQLLDSLEGK